MNKLIRKIRSLRIEEKPKKNRRKAEKSKKKLRKIEDNQEKAEGQITKG
jgi:hypothetical protein